MYHIELIGTADSEKNAGLRTKTCWCAMQARGGKPAAVPIRGMEVMERCASDGGSGSRTTGGAADHATCVCGQCDNNTRGEQPTA